MSPAHSARTLSHKFVTLSQTVLRYVTLTLNVTLEWASGERRKPDIIYTSLSQTKEELAFSIIKNLVGSECFILLFETEWRGILHHIQMHFSGSMDCELYYMFYCPRFHEMFTHYWPTVYVRIHPLVFTQKKKGGKRILCTKLDTTEQKSKFLCLNIYQISNKIERGNLSLWRLKTERPL